MTDPAGSIGGPPALGHWTPHGADPSARADDFRNAVSDLRSPVVVVRTPDGHAVARGGSTTLHATDAHPRGSFPVVAYLPPLAPEQLGDRAFLREHNLRY
ncbi:MAG: 2-nitropropane dioxygenase, partial [Gemmataceae bacterium]|nr:2-nitropropane dioxygenase [Gemmataceae bacterium]